jgi:23S rRNA pseudouridine2605 synthase
MNPVRLQKAISNAGLMSRRAAEELIAAGRVTIDGRLAILGDRVDANTQRVEVDGVPLPVSPALVTYLLYKPVGVISSVSDPEGRPTVTELVPTSPRVVPVGRLDYDSEGLLLMSNDGELILRVTHPRYGMTKTYVATVAGRVSNATMRNLERGVDLEDGPARAKRARVLQSTGSTSLVEIVLVEGRNREVRRMMGAVGHPVDRLVRTSIGPLSDRSLRAGRWRLLHAGEISELYAAAGRNQASS